MGCTRKGDHHWRWNGTCNKVKESGSKLKSQKAPCLDEMIQVESPLSRSLCCTKEDATDFVVNEKLWVKEVADAERYAEQARNERDEEEMGRLAELRTTQWPFY